MERDHGKAIDEILEIRGALEKNLDSTTLDSLARLAAAVYIGTALNRVADAINRRDADSTK